MTSPTAIPDALKAKARDIVAKFLHRFGIEDAHLNSIGLCEDQIRDALLQVRNEAIAEERAEGDRRVLAEREACARLVECDGCDFCADVISTAIRARP